VTAACGLCGAARPQELLRLRATPPANGLTRTREQALAAATYPLRLVRCAACGLVQLADVVSRDLLFSDYKYATGAAPGLVRHFAGLAGDVISRLALAPGAVVVEVGSNDGTLLAEFARRGALVLGVDPATDLARQADADGVPTLAAHFDDTIAGQVLARTGPADLVLGTNVLAHVADLNATLRGIRALMGAGGRGVFEVAHLLPMATRGIYEFIYHEHTFYFSLHALRQAMARHELDLYDAQEVPTQGGSLRCWVRRADEPGAGTRGPGLERILAMEVADGIADGSVFDGFARRVDRVNRHLSDVVRGLASAGRRISAYGASARAVTLLGQCGLADVIDWVADDNPRKVGWYVPGAGLPVVPAAQLAAGTTDYCLLFAWNFAEEIMDRAAGFRASGGSFIRPFPDLTVC
jgi:SAM-dependent methyltransferase